MTSRASPPAVAAPTLTQTRKPLKPQTPKTEDDSSICTFTIARLNATNVGGGSGNTKIKTENLSSYATVKIENSNGTKDGRAQGTGPTGPTAPARSSVPGVVVKEDTTKIFTKNIQTNGAYSAREESLKREVSLSLSLCVCVKFSRNCVWFVRKHWEDLSSVVLNFLRKQTKIIYIISL